MATKIEREIRSRIREKWPDFIRQKKGILQRRSHGRALSEADVEQMFELLSGGPLGYEMWQIGRQQDYADRTLEGQGIKLAVVEIKQYRAFERADELDNALIQAARYADRHRTPNLIAFDGESLVLALRRRLRNDIVLTVRERIGLDDDPPANLFYFTHFGLFRYPKEELRIISYDAEEDGELYKTHHGEKLHYRCFACVGDLRSKSTWKLPYRRADGSIDENRLGHAVNYLLSPGGYRGNLADDNPEITEGTRFMACLTLARAYKELGKWREARRGFYTEDKPSPIQLLYRYLRQKGVEFEDV